MSVEDRSLEETQEYEDEVVGQQEPEEDLDSWYGEEDQSADDDPVDEEESSPSDSTEDESPDHEIRSEGAEEAPEDGAPQQQPAQDDPYAWVHELDPDLKAKVESLVHRDQSNRGRVAALQSRLDRMAAEQDARTRISANPAAAKAVEQATTIEDMDDAELREFMEEYPSVASNVEKLIARRIEKGLESHVRPLQQEAETARLVARKEQLRYNAHHIFNTAETGIELEDVLTSPRFREWIQSQPAGYQNFAKNANEVNEASKVLEDFAKYTDEQVYQQWEYEQTQLAARRGTQSTGQTADQTDARRKAALKGKGLKSRSAELSGSGNVDDYEAYFDQAVSGG